MPGLQDEDWRNSIIYQVQQSPYSLTDLLLSSSHIHEAPRTPMRRPTFIVPSKSTTQSPCVNAVDGLADVVHQWRCQRQMRASSSTLQFTKTAVDPSVYVGDNQLAFKTGHQLEHGTEISAPRLSATLRKAKITSASRTVPLSPVLPTTIVVALTYLKSGELSSRSQLLYISGEGADCRT